MNLGPNSSESPQDREETRQERRRRIRGSLSSIRGHVDDICLVISQVDELLGPVGEIRKLLEDPEVQATLPYRARRRLDRVVAWLEKSKEKVGR